MATMEEVLRWFPQEGTEVERREFQGRTWIVVLQPIVECSRDPERVGRLTEVAAFLEKRQGG